MKLVRFPKKDAFKDYFGLPNSSPGHSYYYWAIFLPGHPYWEQDVNQFWEKSQPDKF